MLNLMIVDDEKNICMGLKNTICWEDLGIHITAIASNGMEAWQQVQNKSIDIIITDVQMPIMDGIELVKKVYEYYPFIKVIVLSGYSCFEYAKSAIRYGVTNYFLKPIQVPELVDEIKKISISLRQQKENEKKELRVQEDYQLLRERALLSFIKEPPQEFDDIRTYLSRYGMEVHIGAYFIMNIQEIHNKNLVRIDIKKVLIKGTDIHISYIFIKDDDALYGIAKVPETITQDAFTKYILELTVGMNVIIGISDQMESLMDGHKAYRQAMIAVKQAFVESHQVVTYYDKLEDRLKNKELKIIKEKLLAEACNNSKSLKPFLEKLKLTVLEKNLDESTVKSIVRSMLTILLQDCLRKKIYSLVYIEYENIIKRLENVWCLDEVLRVIEDFLNTIKSIQENQIEKGKNRIVHEVKEYINNNYHTHLDVQTMSNIINRSPNYISHLFSKHFGETFSNYINQVRIDKAKIFLAETDDTLFSIAKDVGYKDYKYFIKMFKKFNGITPTQYRDLIKVNYSEM